MCRACFDETGPLDSEEVREVMTEKSKKRMWVTTWVLMALSVLVMYVTHREIYFMMDDLWYSTVLSSDTPVTSLRDVIASQIWHYHNWGGRSMTHGILQLTLMAGERAADVLNMAVTLLLAWMICLVAEHKSLPAFFAASALPLGLNANWEMSMFWQSGAANYLYITVFILGYAFCYLRELPEDAGEGKKTFPGITVWILPLGILAGWSNENMGPVAWLLSLLVILAVWKEKGGVRLWMILGNLACLFGSIMMIAAPGNYVRSAQTVSDKGWLWQLYLRCYSEAMGVMDFLFPTLLMLAFMLIFAKYTVGVQIGRRNRLLLFCAFLSWAAMILSPHYPDRAAFGTMTLLICVILSLAGRVLQKRSDLAWPFWWAVVLVWLRGMYFCCEHLGILWGWIV